MIPDNTKDKQVIQMVLRFFRSSFISQYVTIILAGIILWASAFFIPPAMPADSGAVPLYRILFFLLHDLPVVAVILGFILNLVSAFLLNFLLTKHEILPKNSSLAAFLFLFLVSYYPVLLTLHPVTVCLFILLIILDKIFDSYSRQEPLDLAYSAGFLTGIGSMIYLPFILFFGLIIISFIVFRTTIIREWISAVIGLLSPYLFLLVYYFWNDEVAIRSKEFLQAFIPSLESGILRSQGFLAFTGILVLLLLFGIFSTLSRTSERTIEIRRKTLVLIWLAFVVFAGFPFSGLLLPYHLLFSFITVSSLLTLYVMNLKKSFWQELILVILILFVLFHNLFPFFIQH